MKYTCPIQDVVWSSKHLRKLYLHCQVPDDYPGKERPWRRIRGLSGKQYRRQEKALRRRQREAIQ